MIFQIAEKHNVPVYECLASSSSCSKTIVDHLSNAADDFTDRLPMKLRFYIGMPVMATRKHPLLLDVGIICQRNDRTDGWIKVFGCHNTHNWIWRRCNWPSAATYTFATKEDTQIGAGFRRSRPICGCPNIFVYHRKASGPDVPRWNCSDSTETSTWSSKQTLCVALSREVSLSWLTLTEKITRQYLDNFKPVEATVQEIQRLI
ncbi:hypothetical protein JG687_00016746 [Phytophthora cactorum]|uniref:Uncharacterized protein n=1 Tax=Phytophthora cactorum TaxID=29920 RepID=A0A8T1TPW1_9STRA|nr:hypothetical protein GQ600_25204 [Phytophthora cactorum]KAG6946366.1 hypothetical protein JG687_00016746 [Phytophthora cactorum]